MAPPRLWPIRIIGGRDGQDMVDSVRWIMVSASWERVGMEKSMISSSLPFVEVTIEPPWPLASRLRIPASGNLCLTCRAKMAKERPDAPAPWWQMNSGPFLESDGGVR